MKIVRVLVYEGTEEQLKSWLNSSLADGDHREMFSPNNLEVYTISSPIDHEKFGSKRGPTLWEGPYSDPSTT